MEYEATYGHSTVIIIQLTNNHGISASPFLFCSVNLKFSRFFLLSWDEFCEWFETKEKRSTEENVNDWLCLRKSWIVIPSAIYTFLKNLCFKISNQRFLIGWISDTCPWLACKWVQLVPFVFCRCPSLFFCQRPQIVWFIPNCLPLSCAPFSLPSSPKNT